MTVSLISTILSAVLLCNIWLCHHDVGFYRTRLDFRSFTISYYLQLCVEHIQSYPVGTMQFFRIQTIHLLCICISMYLYGLGLLNVSINVILNRPNSEEVMPFYNFIWWTMVQSRAKQVMKAHDANIDTFGILKLHYNLAKKKWI